MKLNRASLKLSENEYDANFHASKVSKSTLDSLKSVFNVFRGKQSLSALDILVCVLFGVFCITSSGEAVYTRLQPQETSLFRFTNC